jgi:hypothetical protein
VRRLRALGSTAKSCYAGILHERKGGRHLGFAPSFQDVTRFEGRMEKAARLSNLHHRNRLHKPWLDGSPRLIFVSDMSDALSSAISFEHIEQEVIRNVTSARSGGPLLHEGAKASAGRAHDPASPSELISELSDGHIAYRIKSPTRGTTHRIMTPVE